MLLNQHCNFIFCKNRNKREISPRLLITQRRAYEMVENRKKMKNNLEN